MATISIEYRPVAFSNPLAGHLYLVYRDEGQGVEEGFAISGGPEFPGLSDNYGRLVSGSFKAGHPNTAGQNLSTTIDTYENTGDTLGTRGSTVLLEGDKSQLNTIWGQMVVAANAIFERSYDYDPSDLLDPPGQALNSNTLIANVLKQAGLPFTLPDAPITMAFPGADVDLSFAGDDNFGGEGVDVINYIADPGGITADLSAGAYYVQDGWGGRDTIDLTGSAKTIIGSRHADIFYGNLESGKNLTLDGGDPSGTADLQDTVSYQYHGQGVYIDLDNGVATNANGSGGTDTLENIENATGTAYNDVITGNDFNNILSGGNGNDNLSGGGGNDILHGGAGIDILDGGDGDDILTGGYENDILNGGAGNDQYIVHGFFDGYDTITDTGGHDTLIMQDQLLLDPLYRAIQLNGTTLTVGRTSILNHTGVGRLERVHAVQQAITFDPNEMIAPPEGEPFYTPFVGTQITSFGATASPTAYQYGDRRWDPVDEEWEYGPRSDTLNGGSGHDSLSGEELSDTLHGNAGQDYLYGGTGGDHLYGGSDNDTLYGDDTFGTGVAGDDHLYGGSGNDSLNGGFGADTYYLGVGDGFDQISETGTDQDTLAVSGFDPAQVRYNVINGDLYILFNGSDGVIIRGQYGADSQVKVEQITGAIVQDLRGGLTIRGTGAREQLGGTAFDDILDGGMGHDDLKGGRGNDTYLLAQNGGLDYVTEYANEGDDTIRIVGGGFQDVRVLINSYDELVVTRRDGTATILVKRDLISTAFHVEAIEVGGVRRAIASFNFEGSAFADAMNGTADDNRIYGMGGDDQINGKAGNDTLDGGAGNDNLIGGTGNDTYVLAAGTGTDMVFEQAGEGDDVIRIEGATWDDIRLTINGYGHLIVSRRDGKGSLAIGDWALRGRSVEYLEINGERRSLLGELTLEGSAQSEEIQGTEQRDIIQGMGGNDWLYGMGGNDEIHGGAGQDMIEGGAGNDTLLGGDGNDTLEGDELWGSAGAGGADTLDGGAGNDHLYGGLGSDHLIGGSGNDTLFGDAYDDSGDADILDGGTGDDTLLGGGGNDLLDGGAGDDALHGGMGDDTYVLSAGNDFAYEESGGGTDVIRIEGTDWSGLRYSTNLLGDLIISKRDGSGSLTIQGWGESRQIEFIEINGERRSLLGELILEGTSGADTMGWSRSDGVIMRGMAGADELYGGTGNDELDGGEGNDELYAGSGNDTLLGGAGDDIMSGGDGADIYKGGTGNDTYQINTGGTDLVEDTAGNDTLQLIWGTPELGGAQVQDILMTRDGDDLVLTWRLTGDQVRVAKQFNQGSSNPYAIERIELYDGTQIEVPEELPDALAGTNGNDALTDTGNGDALYGFQTGGGYVLLQTQVDQLVQAMAAFTPPPPGQLSLSPEVLAQLQPTLAANWNNQQQAA